MPTGTNPLPIPEQAQEIARRILAGEKVPLDELCAFILAAHSEVKGERKKRESGEKEVDFF